MTQYREKFYRAGYSFFGGGLILICWSIVYPDYFQIIFNGENIEDIPGDVLELLFFFYLLPTLGFSFCLIGVMGFFILGIRYYRERD